MNGLTPSAWILWQVIDNHISKEGYLGRQDSGKPDTKGGYWGLAFADHDQEEILLTMKYYAMGQFSRYIRPGDTIIAGDARSVAAYNKEEKRLVIVAANDTQNKMAYCFDLSEFQKNTSSVTVIRTSGSMENGEKWTKGESLTIKDHCLNVLLKENSITTFVIK